MKKKVGPFPFPLTSILGLALVSAALAMPLPSLADGPGDPPGQEADAGACGDADAGDGADASGDPGDEPPAPPPFDDDDDWGDLDFQDEYSCGNDGQNVFYGCDFLESKVGDPVNPYRGNLVRPVKDIETFGNAPIAFVRIYNSRTTSFNAPYWDFGAQQTWQHNWNYEMRQLSSKTHGFNDIKVRYPNGQEYNFTAADATGVQLVPAADSGDRLYRWPGSVVGYTLVTPAGVEYHFQRVGSPKFRLLEVRDGQGLAWTVSHDAAGKVSRISNQFGRYLDIVRETLPDGTERIASVRASDGRTVAYGYSEFLATGTSVLTTVTYPDERQAAYTWVGSDSETTGRPLLASAVDPMLKDGEGVLAWDYNYGAVFDVEGSTEGATYLVTGTVLKEYHPVTGDVVLHMPRGGGPDPLIFEGNGASGERNVRRRFENGLIRMRTDAEGRVTTFGRDNGGMGCVSSRTEPNGGTTYFQRDYAGRPTAVTDPMGNTDRYEYNGDGFLVRRTDRLGNETRYVRDAGNRVVRQENPDGSAEAATYNGHGQRLTATNRLGGVTSYAYYGEGEEGGMPGDLKTVTDPLGNVTAFTHDAAGRLTSMTDPLGRTTSFSHDWRGNVTAVGYPDGGRRAFTYDFHGNLANLTDETGRIWVRRYNAFQRLASVEDPLGNTTSYEYGRYPGDPAGETRDTVALVTLPSGRRVARTYDATGLTLTETTGYGTQDAVTVSYGYTAAGDPSSATDGEGGVTSYATDLLHRVSSVTDPTGRVTSFTYDAMGNRTGVTRPDSLTETVVYDAMGRPVSKTDAMNGITAMTYNAAGKLASVTDPRGQTHAFAYDLKGRETSAAYPDGTSESIAYDAAGNVSSRTSRSGNTLSFARDARGRETLRSWDDGSTPSVATSYDLAGRVLSVTAGVWDGTAMSSVQAADSYAYDEAGRLVSETQSVAGLPPRAVSRTLDADGRTSSLANADGSASLYGWDASGRLASVSDASGLLASYGYDGAGRRTSRTLGNGVSTAYAYDAAGRATGIASSNGEGTFAAFTQAYDAMGGVSAMAEAQPPLPARNRAFAHDALGQLVLDQDSLASPPASGTYRWSYDAAGNRVSSVHPAEGTTLWSADSSNRYVSVGGDEPLHDADGNLSASDGWAFFHDADGLMTDASSSGLRMEIVRDGRRRPVLRRAYRWTTPAVVISQVYAAGGNSGASYDHDFVEIHNRSDAAVSLSGWTLQYAAAAGTNWSATALSGTIPAGGYYLVALHGGQNGSPLPSADATGTSNLAMAGGKVALVSASADLSGACPDGASIVDLVGYGAAASCHWGDGVAPTLDNRPSKALSRLDAGCRSLKDNAADFERADASPRNSASSAVQCDRWHAEEDLALYYDGWDLVAEADGSTGAVLATYVHGAATDELLSRRDASDGQAVFYVHDHLGSVRALTDAEGAVVEHYRYEAFGIPSVSDASGNELPRSAYGNRFMFTGREYLAHAGLYDFRNRTYSPRWGRFIEVDPIRFEGGDLNMYRYVGNGVTRWIDPWGLYTEVIYWLPEKGAFRYGHISIIINGTSYSWELADNDGNHKIFIGDSVSTGGINNGQNSMNYSDSDTYISDRSKEGEGVGVFFDLTEQEEALLAEYLDELGTGEDGYNLLTHNCASVTLDAFIKANLYNDSDNSFFQTPQGVFSKLSNSSRAIGQTYYEKK